MEMTDLLETNLLLGTLILPKEKNDKKKKIAKENVQKLRLMTQSQASVTYAAHTSGHHRNISLWKTFYFQKKSILCNFYNDRCLFLEVIIDSKACKKGCFCSPASIAE